MGCQEMKESEGRVGGGGSRGGATEPRGRGLWGKAVETGYFLPVDDTQPETSKTPLPGPRAKVLG